MGSLSNHAFHTALGKAENQHYNDNGKDKGKL